MAITQNFSVSQNSGTPNIINFTDTSTGSDGAISARRIYLLQSDGTYLVPTGTTTSYISWSYLNSTIDVNVLTQDAALTIKVDWVDNGGNILYTKTIVTLFTAYSETFYYSLTQSETLIQSPNILLSTNYYKNKNILGVLIDSANKSISFASDTYSAQVCLDSAAYMIANSNKFF